MQKCFLLTLLSAAAISVAAPFAAAQNADEQPRRWFAIPSASPAQEIQQFCATGDYTGASTVIQRELLRRPDDPFLLYNGACIASRLGDLDVAGDRLMKSVKAGFRGFSHMRRDPDLIPLRKHAVFRALMAARQAADQLLASRNLQEWQNQLTGKGYSVYSDANQRINYLTQLDPDSFAQLRTTVEAHIQLLQQNLFSPQPVHSEAQAGWVLLVLAGDGADSSLSDRPHVEGVYRHERRELIALNPDISLRHELVHMLHQSHMDELGQQHPIWIQEGLATLWEHYTPLAASPSGEVGWDEGAGSPATSVSFPINERNAIAQSLLAHGQLMSWRELFSTDDSEFQRQAFRTYSEAHSIMRYLATQRRGGVQQWYRLYTAGFQEDPSGAQALEQFFGQSIYELEEIWKTWLASQPIVIDRRGENSKIN